MLRKTNLVLTYASGNGFFTETFWIFVQSFQRHVPDSDLVILTHEMDDFIESRLAEFDVEVVRIPATEMHFLYRDRHLSFWRYLNDHGHKYRYVLTTDCRDVLFQANPFDWVGEWLTRFKDIKGRTDFLTHFVILVSEGFKMSQSGFACIEQFEFERDVPRPYLQTDKERRVCNAGTVLGTPRAMQDFEFLMWTVTMKTIGRCTDQATLNWLMHYLDDDETYNMTHPQHDNLCLTGEGVKEGSVEPILKDGKLFNPRDQLYHLIHQWDRLDYLREDILAQYPVLS